MSKLGGATLLHTDSSTHADANTADTLHRGSLIQVYVGVPYIEVPYIEEHARCLRGKVQRFERCSVLVCSVVRRDAKARLPIMGHPYMLYRDTRSPI